MSVILKGYKNGVWIAQNCCLGAKTRDKDLLRQKWM